MVIWISPARMGKLVGMPLNWVLLELQCLFLEVCNPQKKITERVTFPDQTATFRDLKATLPGQRF